jgi:Zn-dependent protease with chaperone function
MKPIIIKFKLPDGEIIPLSFYKGRKFIAKVAPFGGNIKIGELFYKFSKSEKTAVIYHEIGHKKNNIKIEFSLLLSRRFFLFFWDMLKGCLFLGSDIAKLQEIEADKYSAVEFSKKSTLSSLIKIKKMQDKGEIPIDLKNHPSIEERIKRIRELNLK